MALDDDTGTLRIGSAQGPYDIDDLDTEVEELENSHLDLGSVLVPVVEGGQVTVEMTADHQPEAVYLLTPHGRIGVAAFAAPKSPGLWREVVTELADSLREQGATVAIEDGHWGREVVGSIPGATHRFIGGDGPRWMVRCIASGPTEVAGELAQLARAVLAETVIRRGSEAVPPREPLPVTLPPVLAEQVAAAQQQQLAQNGVPMPDAADAEPTVPLQDPSTDAPNAASEDQPGPTPGGARDQLARAGLTSDVVPEPQPEPVDPVAPERSSGSAMQRLRQLRRR